MWLYISGSYATFGLPINNKGMIASAPPIAKWTIGKYYKFVMKYHEDKNLTVKLMT